MAEVSAGLALALPRGLARRGDGAGAAEVVRERLGAVQRGEDEEGPGVLVGAGGGEAGGDVASKRRSHFKNLACFGLASPPRVPARWLCRCCAPEARH